MRLGIFGGTFDPPHLGHLIVAQDACSALRLDGVLFVLAASPPHKQGRAHTPAAVRLEMLDAATAGDPRLRTSDVELRRDGPSYTVDTLRQLAADNPAAELFLLIGADQAREFGTWREPDEIARLATVVALSREGEAAPPEPDRPWMRWLPVTRIDISATDIRRRVAAGEPIRYLVPSAVDTIIRREGLYRTTESPGQAVTSGTATLRPGGPAESRPAEDRADVAGV